MDKWRKYDKHLSPLSYRIFSKYIGEDINILPMEVCVNIIEPVLTPANVGLFCHDKNSFNLLYHKDDMPKTFIRNIYGKYYDEDYYPIRNDILSLIKADKILIKPSVSQSGAGVDIFIRNSKGFENNKGNILSLEYLDKYYHSDFIIQEYFLQSDFLSQFNPSSVNTLRISTYRDVYSGKIHYLRSFLRMGGQGSIVDNAHAGGVFVGIDDNGKLMKYACNQWGNKFNEHNGIDFSKKDFTVPNWENVKAFALQVSNKFIHHSLFALDVVLDKNNTPKLLEVNVQGFGGWAFQFTSGTCFREYTDDVIEYCSKEINKVKPKIILWYKKIIKN